MRKLNVISVLVAAITLTACGDGFKKTERKVDGAAGAVNASLSRLGDRGTVRAGGAQFSDGIFVGAAAERSNAALLPSHLQGSGAVSLTSRDPLSLTEISQRLSEITGIPHVLALGPTGKLTSASDEVRTAQDIGRDSTDVEARTGAARLARARQASRRADSGSEDQLTMRPNLRGSLSDILDQITNTFDVEWAYSDGRVLFRDYVTRKYQISALPSTSSSSSTIGANDISAESEMSSDIWTEVQGTLEGIVGEQASISIGSTTGLVTVTAKVSDQNRVEDYIKQLNGTIGQQISFDINVLSVSLNEGQNFGLDLQAAFDGGNWTGSLSGVSNGTDSAGSVNIGVIRGIYDISAVASALSSQGNVSVSNRAGATTSNNRVAPIQVTDKVAYIKEASITENSDGVERVQRTVDEVETGFQMQLFPRILNNRDIMVQYTVRLSELNRIEKFGDGRDALQLPDVSTTSFEQQAVLENGQTLVLAGFERNRAEINTRKSAGGLLGLGGSQEAKTSRVATVMLITPRILGRSGSR